MPLYKMCDYHKFLIFAMITLTFLHNNAASSHSDLILDVQLKENLLDVSCQLKCSHNITSNNRTCVTDLDIAFLPISNVTLDLVCKETDKIVLRYPSTNSEDVYFLETKLVNETAWQYVNRTTSCYLIANKLIPNEEYRFRVWLVSTDGIIYQPVESNYVKTMALEDRPLPVSAIDLLRYEYSTNQSDYKAIITWKPSPDKSCHHEFVWFGDDDVSDYTPIEVEIPYDFTLTINKLSFASNYSVAAMTKSANWSQESDKVWYHFMTPSCLEVLKTLEFCAPDMPTGIETQEVFVDVDDDARIYNINVTWDEPQLYPDWYLVQLNTFQQNFHEEMNLVNISGNSTSVMFQSVPLELHYQIAIFAQSKGGSSDPGEYYKQINVRDIIVSTTPSPIGSNVFLIFVLPLAGIFCVISALLVGYKEWNKREQIINRQRYFEELELKSHYLDSPLADENCEKPDEWEIEQSCLTLHNILGRGAFGLVRKGWLQRGDATIPVAIKMLLDDHRYADIREFKQEIEIMKSVGSHPHIVSLIGCCTKGKPGDLQLVVEYCSRGDLLSYLRSAWDQITNQCSNKHYENVEMKPTNATNIDNKLYLLGVTETWNMQIKDLISIGLQVAMGMEYLSSLHVLHRDLAARNVLVCENQTVKVSDFGLSRDVYRDNVYCKTSSGKLPIRWLALESLTHQMYTTHSDVWSYGILLWEIITLGGNPYPGVQTHELLDHLLKGYRMSCPLNCSPELYAVMMSCWSSNLKERPSFTDIRHLLENILEDKSEYLNLNLCSSFHSLDDLKLGDVMTSVPLERYVKPFAS